MKKYLLVVGIIFLLVMMSFTSISGIQITNQLIKPSGRGNTLYVGGSGPGNYTKIQDAIDDALDGDTVFVYAFSSPYYENIIVDKSITLIGEDKNNTVIEGQKNYHGIYVIRIKANYVNINGLTIQSQGKYDYSQHGIDVLTPYNVIEGNIIQKTKNGIYLDSANRNIIKNNTIRSNYQNGIYSSSSVFNVIENNYFNGNNFEGIDIGYSDSDYLIKDNILFDDYIEMSPNSFNHIIVNNTVNGKKILYFENEYDINICEDICGQIILNNCENCENFNLENQKARISLFSSNNCNIYNNSISDVNIGIHLYYSDYNVINNCNLSNIRYKAIYIWESNNNIITNNNVKNGIKLFNSLNNKIEDNSINYMYFFQSSFNTIKNNMIFDIEIDSSISNIFMRNTVEGNFNISYTSSHIISNNNFRNCQIDSHISDLNIISKNNFYDSNIEFTQSIYQFFLNNIFRENYWGEPRYSPVPIYGKLILKRGWYTYFICLWVCFDWRPASEPYDIHSTQGCGIK
jgi:parallel beta-helix repeat protein